MSQEQKNKRQGEVKVIAAADKVSGEYCNVAAIRHSQAEFILDFVFRMGHEGHLVSRVITNPRHAKALLVALEDNVKKYEAKFGPLTPAPQPDTLH